MILVTGGAGFIGANFVLRWIATRGTPVVNVDKLTYAGNLGNLKSLNSDPRHTFVRGDIVDREFLRSVIERHKPEAIVHFAAESHVDRSIHGPGDFINTNIVGTFHLLEEARGYWSALSASRRASFRFLHVSTDEVYGSLSIDDPPFSESKAYEPNSPYSASKAASDHLVRAYCQTYGLPTLTTNCSNNYGPYQFPEKLVPLVILNALNGKSLPVYGDGLNVRDWLFVEDHCDAICRVLDRGRVGETYNIGGNSEMKNIDVVRTVCRILDEIRPDTVRGPREALISYVKDRPGHDRRYAIDASKIRNELGWAPLASFASGMLRTVEWYLSNMEWIDGVTSGKYKSWVDLQYGGERK